MKNTINKIHQYGLWKSLNYLLSEIKYIIYFRLILNSYSQKQEDIFIDKIIGIKKKGIYVDIGANDPIRFNNTYRFYKKGWKGLNVEPNINKIKKLKQIRPRDKNINCGIGNSNEKIMFYSFFTDTLSTFSKKEADKYLKQGFKIEYSKKISTMPLKELFKKHKINNIDFLTIDTEGYDYIILKSNNWNKYRPKIICIENVTQNNTNKEPKIFNLLKKNKYKLIQNNGLNSIFKNDE